MINREISDAKFQIDSLDGLRGIAALIVVFSHTSNDHMHLIPFLDLGGIGKSGVFLFFLLSSFLLTVPLLAKGREIFSRTSMLHYWQRRFFRIYPLYTLYLLLGVFTTWLFTSYFNITKHAVPFRLNLEEFFRHIILQDGKGVSWSIAVEFKFYFALPFLVYLIFHVRKLGFVVLLAFMVILIGISQLIFPQSEVIPNDPQLSPYISIFLMGITLAALQTEIIKRPQFPDRYLKTIGILGYVGLASVIIMVPSVYSIIFKNVDNSYFHKQLLLQSLCWALVLLSAVNVRGFIQNICKLRMLRFFGTLSFSLYLFHPIVIGALQFFEIDTPVNGWIVLAVSTLAAFISFKLFEEPLSRVKILKS